MKRFFSTTKRLKQAIEINGKNFKEEVLDSKVPVLLDCYGITF